MIRGGCQKFRGSLSGLERENWGWLPLLIHGVAYPILASTEKPVAVFNRKVIDELGIAKSLMKLDYFCMSVHCYRIKQFKIEQFSANV